MFLNIGTYLDKNANILKIFDPNIEKLFIWKCSQGLTDMDKTKIFILLVCLFVPLKPTAYPIGFIFYMAAPMIPRKGSGLIGLAVLEKCRHLLF